MFSRKGSYPSYKYTVLTFILNSASLLAAQDNLCKGMPAQEGIIPAGGLALAGTLKPSACLLGLTFSWRWSSVKVKLHLPFATRSSWGKLQASEWLTWDIMVICFDINGIACLGEKYFLWLPSMTVCSIAQANILIDVCRGFKDIEVTFTIDIPS